MRPPVPTHPDEDRLLELAYGEVPASEARALRQHVDACARCRKVLEGIAEVRTAFRSIPGEPAPERGLESLLAYGEQAAARARSRRGGLRILALLSAATALAVVWLVVPRSRPEGGELARSSAGKDVVARLEVPPAPEQGDRARDALDAAKGARENRAERQAPAALPVAEPRANAERPVAEEKAPARRAVAEPERKQKELAKLDAPAERPKGTGTAAGAPSDGESAQQSPAVSNMSGALAAGGAAGGQVGAAGTVGSSAEAGAAKKRSRLDDELQAVARPVPATPPSAAAGPSGADEGRVQQATKIAAAPPGESVASSEDKGAAGKPLAKTVAKPSPKMEAMRVGAGSPEAQARLAEIRRQLGTSKGDQRKALLLEKCELEASLQLGPDAVLTCSMVTREFPGTPEAKRAGDIARGFSVQPPAGPER